MKHSDLTDLADTLYSAYEELSERERVALMSQYPSIFSPLARLHKLVEIDRIIDDRLRSWSEKTSTKKEGVTE